MTRAAEDAQPTVGRAPAAGADQHVRLIGLTKSLVEAPDFLGHPAHVFATEIVIAHVYDVPNVGDAAVAQGLA